MRLLLALLTATLVLAQQPDEPYPGQRNHQEPPKDWYCMGQNYELSVPPAHVCACERMCDTETGQLHEDQKCTVYCHHDHCHCQIANHQACKGAP